MASGSAPIATAVSIAEDRFFALAAAAFPVLVFHRGLSFGGFDGTYPNLRDRVVTILSGLSDHFSDAFHQAKGLPDQVQALLGSHRVKLSPESPNTRGSTRLMRLRDVEHEGRTFRCEWHAKLEPHRNRIHFATPDEQLGGKILVGIFTPHLPT